MIILKQIFKEQCFNGWTEFKYFRAEDRFVRKRNFLRRCTTISFSEKTPASVG